MTVFVEEHKSMASLVKLQIPTERNQSYLFDFFVIVDKLGIYSTVLHIKWVARQILNSPIFHL